LIAGGQSFTVRAQLPEGESAARPTWRSLSALLLAPDGETLYAAGAKSGALAAIDLPTRKVVSEIQLGQSLVAIAGTSDGQTLVACDADADMLLIAHADSGSFRVRTRIPMPSTPASVSIGPDGSNCFVSSRWARVVVQVDINTGKIMASVPLNFSPHCSIFLPDDQTLVVADAFGGRLALIDTKASRLIREVEIPGHNIRGMALSADGKHLLITHSIVTESAATTRDNVFWGILMTSNMRVIPILALLNSQKNPVREAHTHFFGDPGNAAGDPEALAILPDGTTIVCLAGVGEVAVGRYAPYGFRRVQVGQRPSAIAVSPDQKWAYVANAHSDTISIVDIAERTRADTVPLGAGANLTLAQHGERLFYDAKLSLDGWFSCHTCHTDGHTNGQRADTFGDGSHGAAKSILSLLGTSATEPWAWNGSKRTLEEQVRESMRTTMQPKVPVGERDVAALTAYLRTLRPPPAGAGHKLDAQGIARGEKLFSARGCASCHVPPTYTNAHVYDVGLDDGDGGNREFNPPSLRGLIHIAPYFHDGRAKTLEEVFQKYQHRLRSALSDDELRDLLAYLKSL
jgi:YVTN family beta-propeller protein